MTEENKQRTCLADDLCDLEMDFRFDWERNLKQIDMGC